MANSTSFKKIVFSLVALAFLSGLLQAQGTLADYGRALKLRDTFQGLAVNMVDRAAWVEKTSRFWYRRSVKGGYEFMMVDAETLARNQAFDHGKMAEALGKAIPQEKITAINLPFDSINFVDGERAVEFVVSNVRWKVDLGTYAVTRLGEVERWRTGWEPIGVTLPERPVRPPVSPDGKWEAIVKGYNIYLRSLEKDQKDEIRLTYDGSEGNYYSLGSIRWAPDSKKLAAYRILPGYKRIIHFVESSPSDQLQPKYHQREYRKPGDPVDIEQPVLFILDSKEKIEVKNNLFPNPYELSQIVWRKDSRAFTFEYNERGHRVYRVIEVDGKTGAARAIIDEQAKTFFSYSGKKYRYDVEDGREIIWMSERDGWNHLYLYDGATGDVKNQITRGEWVVRGVDKVDEDKRQIWFRASGMYPGKDPYLVHYYRINFDGTGLTPLTESDANHTVVFSSDMKYYVDTWSRVDLPTVCELRRTDDRKILMEVEKADIAPLVKAGWRTPEVFSAPGRDGKTDIWGIIFRPSYFKPNKKFPVIEYIYAGPHSSFVPKSFFVYNQMQAMAELGFIVVQIDGMGTSNRSKAFHDVSWKNLADAGFPDRILWHKAVAAKYPYYDISRVGIYGHSAGGQNALAALLFHPEFYKAAVSSCGCHDNRMDKIWWNEQWLSWPVGEEYAASSNTENAHRLKGKLLLVVGELDTNVDPATTMQVVNALIKANKTFDLLVLPGQGHTPGGLYGERKRYDFFVHSLLGIEPPDWNRLDAKK